MILKSCFYQIRLSAEARERLGIVTPEGTFYSEFLGFGPKNAPSASTRMLNTILMGLQEHCIGRIDDILIASATEEEHCRIHLELFTRLKAKRAQINVDKKELFRDSLIFIF